MLLGDITLLLCSGRRYFNIAFLNYQQGVVAHSYNPRYLGGGEWKDHVLRPTQQKVPTTPSQSLKSWVWWHRPVTPDTQEA
jgi:hypothetical protein